MHLLLRLRETKLFEDLFDNRGLPGGENAPAVETSRNSNDSDSGPIGII